VMYQYEWWARDERQGECPAARELLAGNLVLPMHHGSSRLESVGLIQVMTL